MSLSYTFGKSHARLVISCSVKILIDVLILVRRRHIFTTQSISSLSTTANTFSLLTTMAHLHYSSHIFTTQPYHDRTSSLSKTHLHYLLHIFTTHHKPNIFTIHHISSLFITPLFIFTIHYHTSSLPHIFTTKPQYIFTIHHHCHTPFTAYTTHLHYPPHISTTRHLLTHTNLHYTLNITLQHIKIVTSSLHKSSLRIQVHIFTTSSIQLFQDDFKNLYYRKLRGSLCAS